MARVFLEDPNSVPSQVVPGRGPGVVFSWIGTTDVAVTYLVVWSTVIVAILDVEHASTLG